MSNQGLPIHAFKEHIVEEVRNNQVVVITAETGAGKSTQVPQYLNQAGFELVITQPRRLAARTVAERVAEEMGVALGGLVGFRTAEERQSSRDTKILFCTDGLQLVRELTGYGVDNQILVIDEVHEWNQNMEVLVAWAKRQMKSRPDFKVVLMSATIKAERLAQFFGTTAIISVPGRLFHVVEHHLPGDPWDHALDLAKEGHNVLVFVPGKAEINKVLSELQGTKADLLYELIPLHGGMTSTEQAPAFRHYDRPKIIAATNVAQTSITIDDIDAVVDSGEIKQIEVVNGIEGLQIDNTSQADCLQRKGRAGRTKEGVYILCGWTRFEDRIPFTKPEIERSLLDQMVLRLAESGLDATELEFFHQPPLAALKAAKDSLIHLGAMDEAGNVTKTGYAMSEFKTVNVNHARALVEAMKFVEETSCTEVLDGVAIAVACENAGGIRMKPQKNSEGAYEDPAWKELTKETKSDVLAEVDCYLAALKMKRAELRSNGIHVKNFEKAKEAHNRLSRQLGLPFEPGILNRDPVRRCIASGMVDHLYRYQLYGGYNNGSRQTRKLDMISVIEQADWVVGKPFDLPIMTKHGPLTLNLLLFATAVEPEWLIEVAPQLVKKVDLGYVYSTSTQEMVYATETHFNGQLVELEEKPAQQCTEATAALAAGLAKGTIPYKEKLHNNKVVAEVNQLMALHEDVHPIDLESFFLSKLGDRYLVSQLPEVDLALSLTEQIPAKYKEEVVGFSPEVVVLADGGKCFISYTRGWRIGAFDYTLRLPASSVSAITALPQPKKEARLDRIEALDEYGSVVATGYDLPALKLSVARYEKRQREEQARRVYTDQVEELRRSKEVLDNLGRNTAALGGLIYKASHEVSSLFSLWRSNGSTSNAERLIRQARNEIERLSGDGESLLLEDLFAGKIEHPDLAYNKQVLDKLISLSIRSGGYIEVPTKEQLTKHYSERLNGIERVDQLMATDLKIDMEDWAPAELVSDLETEMAPASLELESNKGTVTTPVRYTFVKEGDDLKPIGIVSVPIKVYERTPFPTLSHNITLILEVVEQNRVVARGEEGEQLTSKVKKYQKGKNRSKHADKGLILDGVMDDRRRQSTVFFDYLG